MNRRNFLLLAAGSAVLVAGSANARQPLRVGSSANGVPFAFLDTKTNKMEGLLSDVVREVSALQDFEPEFAGMTFTALIPALTGGKIDLISTGLLITPEREKVVAFTQPVLSYGEGLFVDKKDTTQYTKLDELRGKTVGIAKGSAYIPTLEEHGITDLKFYENTADILSDVNVGRLGFAIGDGPQARYRVNQNQFPQVRNVDSYIPVIKNSVGFAVRKEDTELLAKINASLTTLRASGAIDKITAKWGVS